MSVMKDWWKHTIAYEIYPSSFQDSNGDGVGDLNGITSRLDYLKSLNVGAIWLTPVYASPMVDNGYDVANFYEINPLYGSMDDMERLIAEAGKRNIKIVMDLVFNHTSEECEWFKESQRSRNNPKSNWYIWKDGVAGAPGKRPAPPNNWRGIFGGSVWEWCEERGQYYMHTFATQQPDLNWENPEVRQALYDIANFWIKKGVGGFRIDAIPYIKKPDDFGNGVPDAGDGMVSVHTMTVNTPGILSFLKEFKRNVTEGKNVFTVAEANGVGPDDLKYWVGENGAFDMLFEFGHLHDVEIWCKPSPYGIVDFKKAILASQKATAENGWYPAFFENHDKPRCVNNYFSESVARDSKRCELASKAMGTLLMTLRGTPFLYEGQEIGMTNVQWNSIEKYNEINTKAQYRMALQEGFSKKEAMDFVNRFSRDNARTPMQWDSSANAGFTAGSPWLSMNDNYPEINVEGEDADPDSVLNYYRRLIGLRKKMADLDGAPLTALIPEHKQVIAYRRGKGTTVLVNMGESEASYDENLVAGQAVILCNYDSLKDETSIGCQSSKPGILRPLEAVIYGE